MKETGYRVSEDVAYRELRGQMLFLRPGDRFLYTMNDTGKFVWEQVVSKKPVEKIVTAFGRAFGVSEDVARRDVDAFLRELEEKKIIVGAGK